MNKQEIYALLRAQNIWHEVTEHKAVFNMAEVAENGTRITLFDA